MKLHRFLPIAGLILFLALLYGSTTPKHDLGYADVSEFHATGTNPSVAHPSGYPLTTLWAFLFTQLLQPLTSASHAINLSNAIATIISLCLLYLITKEVLKSLHPPISAWIQSISALAATALVATSGMIWLYAVNIEVQSINLVFLGILTYNVLLWMRQPTSVTGLKHFYATWVFAGLGLGHIQSFILVFPSLLIALITTQVWRLPPYRKVRTWVFAIIGFCITLLLYVVLLWTLNNRQQPYSWYIHPSSSGVIHFITRQDYVGNFQEDGVTRSAYTAPITFKYLTVQPVYFNYLIEHLTLPVILLALIGIVTILVQDYKPKWFLISMWLLVGPIFAARLGHPPEISLETATSIGVLLRQYLMSEYLLGIFISIGIAYLSSRYLSVFSNKFTNIVIPSILIALILTSIYSNHTLADQRDNQIITRYAEEMLKTAKPNALIICGSDITCFSLINLFTQHNPRPDIDLVTKCTRCSKYKLFHKPELYQSAFESNPYYLADLLSHNFQNRPVYLTSPTDYYIEYIGLDANPFILIPQGYLFEVVLNPSTTQIHPYQYTLSQEVIEHQFSNKDYFGIGLRNYFASLHQTIAMINTNINRDTDALFHYQLAYQLGYSHLNLPQISVDIANYQGKPEYLEPSASPSAKLYQQYLTFLQNNDYQEAYEALKKVSYIHPQNPDHRLELADILTKGEYFEEAYKEISTGLNYNPQDIRLLRVKQQLQLLVDQAVLSRL